MKTKKISEPTTTKSNMHKHNVFTIIKDNDGKFRIGLGDALISDKSFDKLTEAKQYIDSKPYEIIINIACFANYVMSENHENEKQISKKDN